MRGIRITSRNWKNCGYRDSILKLLGAGPRTLKQMRVELVVPSSSLDNALSDCVKGGLIEKVAPMRGSAYRLVERKVREEWHGIPAGRPYRLQKALEAAGMV